MMIYGYMRRSHILVAKHLIYYAVGFMSGYNEVKTHSVVSGEEVKGSE